MPDLDKAMLLARTFEVSCDYLLGTNEVPSKTELNQEVYLSEADANKYLSISKKMARLIPAGVTLCILSPIPLLVLAYFANAHKHGVTDNLAGGIGVTILLAMVCCAVGLFVYVHYLNAPYEYLEKEHLYLDGQTRQSIETLKKECATRNMIFMVCGVCICVVGAMPIIITSLLASEELIIVGVAMTLAIVAGGVCLIVSSATSSQGFDRVLEQGEYSRSKKILEAENDWFASIYWPLVVALYLGYSFITNDWARSWIIWPVAALLFAALTPLVKSLKK